MLEKLKILIIISIILLFALPIHASDKHKDIQNKIINMYQGYAWVIAIMNSCDVESEKRIDEVVELIRITFPINHDKHIENFKNAIKQEENTFNLKNFKDEKCSDEILMQMIEDFEWPSKGLTDAVIEELGGAKL
jgi:hypothetical protein